MRRTLLLIAFVGLLLCSASAFAIRPGYNDATKRLEGAFKAVAVERTRSEDGCYPPPHQMVAAIRRNTDIKVDLAAGFGSVRRLGVVYVIRRRAHCDRVRMGLRSEVGVYVLNSARGPVYVIGREGQRHRDAVAAGRGPLRALTLDTRSFQLTGADERKRLLIRCPGRKFPLGGGMISNPSLSADGEGIYPHSYERLGVQRGFHISAVLIDPDSSATTSRKVTVQVVCGLGMVPTSSPHKTVFVRPGETETVVARCSPGQHLFSGGFQRTNFTTPFRTAGGNFVTESRAIGPKAWRVAGHAVGAGGGELTAMAYCDRSKRRLLSEVSDSTPLAAGQSATATTPACPRGRRLTSGGFSFDGSQDAFFAGGSFNHDGTWSATAFGYFGAAPSLTAYGYCLRPGRG